MIYTSSSEESATSTNCDGGGTVGSGVCGACTLSKTAPRAKRGSACGKELPWSAFAAGFTVMGSALGMLCVDLSLAGARRFSRPSARENASSNSSDNRTRSSQSALGLCRRAGFVASSRGEAAGRRAAAVSVAGLTRRWCPIRGVRHLRHAVLLGPKLVSIPLAQHGSQLHKLTPPSCAITPWVHASWIKSRAGSAASEPVVAAATAAAFRGYSAAGPAASLEEGTAAVAASSCNRARCLAAVSARG